MNIPEGYETVKQRAKRTGESERTIRYWLKHGKIPYRTVKVSVRVIPVEAEPLGKVVKSS